jgi:RNA 2',3'-cyclic 3'-phosphodiesterase
VRLFVGIGIDAAVIAAAQALATALRQRAQDLAPGARITWIPPDLMHLTLRFIGHVDEPYAARIAVTLAPSVTLPPFALALRGAGVFPEFGAPRVLWAGVQSGAVELRQLEGEIGNRLAAVGIPPDERPFNPHLTLARVRNAAGLRSSVWLAPHAQEPVGTSRVDAITLYESRLSPQGPTYVPLQRTPLVAI